MWSRGSTSSTALPIGTGKGSCGMTVRIGMKQCLAASTPRRFSTFAVYKSQYLQ